MLHYDANTIHKDSYPQEIWIGYNIELANLVYMCKLITWKNYNNWISPFTKFTQVAHESLFQH